MKTESLCEVVMDVAYKYPRESFVSISGANDIYKYLRNNWHGINHIEKFVCIYLDRANKIVATKIVSTGGVSGTVVDVRVIYQGALLCNASSVILAHNHPSGQLVASSADIKVTKKIKTAGEVLDVAVLDHIILTDESYLSFANEGML